MKLFGEMGGTAPFAGLDSPEAMGKRIIELTAMTEGQGIIKLPGENATAEEIAAFRKKIGVPEDAAGYEFKDPGYPPESGLKFNEEMASWATSVFLEAGVPKDVAHKLLKAWDERAARTEATARAALDQDSELVTSELKQQFGKDYPQAMHNMKMAVRKIAGDKADEVEAFLNDPLYGSNRTIMQFLTRLGKFYATAVGEEALRLPDGGGGSHAMTVADAEAEIKAVMSVKDGPYWNRQHPDHAKTRQRIDDLYKIVTPNRQRG